MRFVVRAFCACLALVLHLAHADERLSDPALNIHLNWTGFQIFAPDCTAIADLSSSMPLKWARTYEQCTEEAHRQWLADMRQFREEQIGRASCRERV